MVNVAAVCRFLVRQKICISKRHRTCVFIDLLETNEIDRRETDVAEKFSVSWKISNKGMFSISFFTLIILVYQYRSPV